MPRSRHFLNMILPSEHRKRSNSKKKTPSQTAILRVLKIADSFRQIPEILAVSFKRQWDARGPRLEDALFKWSCSISNKGAQINGEILKHYGEFLSDSGNKLLPYD